MKNSNIKAKKTHFGVFFVLCISIEQNELVENYKAIFLSSQKYIISAPLQAGALIHV